MNKAGSITQTGQLTVKNGIAHIVFDHKFEKLPAVFIHKVGGTARYVTVDDVSRNGFIVYAWVNKRQKSRRTDIQWEAHG